MPGLTSNRLIKRFIWIAFVVTAVIFILLMLQKHRGRHNPPPPPPEERTGTMVVTLFFAAPDGSGLVRESREIDTCSDLQVCIDDLVTELATGPLGDLAPTVPDNTMLRGVKIEGATAIIDLGQETVMALPAGSSSEFTAVYSIVNSICYNFPQIAQVQFLVEGGKQPTLKEHFDLRKPIAPNMTLERTAPQS